MIITTCTIFPTVRNIVKFKIHPLAFPTVQRNHSLQMFQIHITKVKRATKTEGVQNSLLLDELLEYDFLVGGFNPFEKY